MNIKLPREFLNEPRACQMEKETVQKKGLPAHKSPGHHKRGIAEWIQRRHTVPHNCKGLYRKFGNGNKKFSLAQEISHGHVIALVAVDEKIGIKPEENKDKADDCEK